MLSAADVRAAAQSRIRLELLANLVRKDLKVKYKNSALGFLWSLANPLLYLVVFDLVFSVFLKNGVPYYAVMFMSGLLVWNFFNLSTLSATGVVVGSANLVRKVRFPRVVLPLASVGFAAVHFVLQMLVFFAFLLVFYRAFIGPQLVLLLPALAVVLVFTVAMALLVSALNVRYRDVEHLLEILLLAWFWLTPIVYPIRVVQEQLVPKHLFALFMANPMTAVVTSIQRATSLKERFLQTRRSKAEEFWALRDIDLNIHGGETVGLIGANGSGKSTLLKLLAGILEPTAGTVRVRGRVASLLELGAGFNGELTGRENIYLNASILGLTRREINRNFDSIVEFSGLEQFIDNQVKHYSSGQYVRLGFAIAVHVDPDVLLVDEVLAVGDEAFQAKCLAKITEFQERGCTILFVTHAVDLVPRLCSRGLVLDHGRVLHDGDALEAAERLRTLLGTAPDQSGGAAGASSALRITGVRMVDPSARSAHKGEFQVGEPLAVEVDVAVGAEPPPAAAVRVAVTGPADVPMWVMDAEEEHFEPNGNWTVRFFVKELPPIQGIFALAVALREPGGRALDARRFSEALRVIGSGEHGLVDVAWTIERTEEEERAEPSARRRPRAAGDRGRRSLQRRRPGRSLPGGT